MVKSYTLSQNTFFLMMAYVIEKALVFFYFIFLARYFGPENFGIYNFALSFVTPFMVLMDLGFSTVLIRETAKTPEKAKSYLENALTFKIISSAVIGLLIIVVINLLSDQATIRQLVYLFVIWAIFESLASTFFSFFRGMHNLQYESRGLIINKFFYVVLGSAFIILKLPLSFFALPLIFGGFFYLLYPLIISRKLFFLNLKIDKAITKHFFKISLPIVFSVVFSTVFFSVNTVLISFFSSNSAAGLFSAAFRIPMAMLFLAGAIGASVFPVFSSLIKNNKERLSLIFERVVFYMIILAVPLMFGGWLLGDQIINLIYGQEFVGAIISFRIIVSISLFLFLDFVFSSLLTAMDKQKENALSRGLGLLINIILCFVLIPRFAQLGGAIAFIVGFIIFSFVQMFLITKIIKFNLGRLFKKGFLVTISSLIMVLILLILKNNFHLFISLFIGSVVYFLFLYLIGGIKKIDLLEMRHLINSSFKKKSQEKIDEKVDEIKQV
ncbi:MAG: flippase [Ignavibacterium sp.]|nr:flippase [Ignavibacterium sp.]